jgi:hypothetical protein
MLDQVEVLTIPRLIAITITSTLGLILWILVRLGAFMDVALSLENRGPLVLVGMENVGAYHTTVSRIIEVESWFAENGFNCDESFGEYLDPVGTISEDRLRSVGGCVVVESEREMIAKRIPERFKMDLRSEQLSATAEFLGSPSIAPYKVYPRLEALVRKEGLRATGPILEIYRVKQGRTSYHLPVTRP